MPQEYTHQLPFDSSDLTVILAAALRGLADADTFDDIAVACDVHDNQLSQLRDRLRSHISGKAKSDVANTDVIAAAPELLASLEWITRCAKMPGPCGTTVYFINDATMDRAKAAVAKAKGGAK